LALAHEGKLLRCWREQFNGDRQAVRLATVRAGLMALCDAVEDRET
jgi:nicotinamide-nucleotide amidase